ncbi:DHA2 family efflux MFS transporter permease subunit [Limosilactobacillus antri]|uniref:Drug resistance MFS transporter, drug:H+ antiporter-2 family n=1 Tax=Limosilactobacillus antri DSM 16041 TaxID=525309 RepID=C8P7B4_9LACO|nr:drug resistance MFS transporter, drug:H+ antiporter-2 family [Limosilactobacillus antri DSM 16041]KRK56780.1 lincomycin resistance protein LmrB [Limosilactobacillus antri DSM 16041]
MENTMVRGPLRKIKRPKLAMASMLLGAFVGMFSETSLNIALPTLMRALQVNAATIQWLVTGYMLVIGIILPLSSIITRWFTTRQVIIFALADFIVGAVISALGNSFAIVLIGRMIQGVGTGLILPLMFAVVMQIFPPQKIGAVMGICALVIMFAPAIGPTLTGLILARLSWQWIFWLFIPFLAVAVVLAVTGLENVGEVTRPHVDVLSILESAVGCSGLVIGASLASRFGWLGAPVVGALAVGVVVLFLYIHRQLHLAEPILNLRVFQHRTFTIGTCLVMLDFGIILSAMYLLPMYIQNGLLLPVALAGIIMLPGGIINAVTSAVAGRLYDSIGVKRPAVVGAVLALIGVVMLLLTSTRTPVAFVIAAHVVLMVGCPLIMSPAQTSALNSLPGLATNDGSTILNTVQQIVGALATALATSSLELGQRAGDGSAASRFTRGVHYGFVFTLVLVVLAFILTLLIREPQREK